METNLNKKVTGFYVDVIAGDSVAEILAEAEPNQRTKEYAFKNFM